MKTKQILNLLTLLGVAFTADLHAQLPNAWQITDNSVVGGTALSYTTNLPPDLQATINSSGFSYSATVRVPTNNPGSKTMALGYGLGTGRFLVWLDLDSTGNLTAELDGGQTYTLTTNGTGASAYHTYDIDYNGSVAAYRVDGHTFTTTWAGSGNAMTAGQVFWGSGSSPGTGAINVHELSFDVSGVGVVAQYDAGTEGNPAFAPDPLTQGWTNNIPPTNAAPLSPDTVAFPVTKLVTTLPGTALTPHQVRLEGVVNTRGQMAGAWFEWGTNTSYGKTTPEILLKGDTNDVLIAQNINGLAAGATYHYRLVAYNLGSPPFGQDETVMTLPSFLVTTLASSGPGSLRQAIADASAGDSIVFDTNGTITLTGGQLLISKDLTIHGPGPENLAISGNNATRVFHISAAITANLFDLKIRNGRTPNGAAGAPGTPATISNPGVPGGDGGNGFFGGGVYNSGTLTLSNCVVTDNRTGNGGTGSPGPDGNVWDANGLDGGDGGDGGRGGGIYNEGVLTLIACTITNNSTGIGGNGGDGGDAVWLSSGWGSFGGSGGEGGRGGAIYNAGTLQSSDCKFDDNACGLGGAGGDEGAQGSFPSSTQGGPGAPGVYGSGGGLFNAMAVATLNNSTLSAGYASYGGGIFNQGTLTLICSTLSGNTANFYHGGGIENYGTLTLINSTLSGNTATSSNPSVTPYGGGILNAGAISITNTIVAGNVAGTSLPDLAGHGSVSGMANLIGGDPMLTPLGDYGGSTPTMRPLSGSPAIDAGLDSAASSLPTDQRGFPRFSGEHVDIGAAEAQWAPADIPPRLTNLVVHPDGTVNLGLTSSPNADLTMLATTNVALPLNQWTPIGIPTQRFPGLFQFTDSQAPDNPHRFYGVRSP